MSETQIAKTENLRGSLRRLRALALTCVCLSIATVLATYLMRDNGGEVNATVWIRGVIVAGVALITLSMALVTAHGSRGAWWRLRILSAVQVVAVVVIVAVPGSVPLWMKIEQALCGLLLVVIVGVVNSSPLRGAYAGSRS